MLDSDVPVWYRFLDRFAPAFSALYYDILLGGPWLTPEQEKDPLQRMWRYNISKRADAIGVDAGVVWIIEVSSYPGLRAIGQLAVYKALWDEDPKITGPVKLVLVAERLDNDLGAALGIAGIQVFLV